ncbi:MAG: kelch repeat-containing protein [Gemmatimonadales bacterium]
MRATPRGGWIAGLLLLTLGARSADPGVGTLRFARAMEAPRASHSASPLADGTILVAGGMGGEGQPVAGAVRFDPASNRFKVTGPMRTRRFSHSATVLPDGRVLLAGGYAESGAYLSSAEIYDPTTGRFTPTGPLGTPRADHVAVLLADGRVLLIGGVSRGWLFLASAEIFDPATGRFSPTGSMSVPRESHVAVRLSDGRVLVAGGHSGRGTQITIYASAEVFDPAAGTFAGTGEMTIPRHKHDGVLLPDGRVLINGGADQRDDEGTFKSTEFYDPDTGRFAAGGDMHLARYKHRGTSLVLPSGKILIAGGAEHSEVFDPETSRFAMVGGSPRMPGQFSAAALLPGGGALISGGYGRGQGPTNRAWRYVP